MDSKTISAIMSRLLKVAQFNQQTVCVELIKFVDRELEINRIKHHVITIGANNDPEIVFLVLKIADGLFVQRHRTGELTEEFCGRRVSEDWVRGFIEANRERALSVPRRVAARNVGTGVPNDSTPSHFSDDWREQR